MDTKKIIDDTTVIVLARVLEIMDENPTQAKRIIKELYEEMRLQ